MPARRSSEVPACLSRLGERFADWRKRRVPGQRIPEKLWDSAVRTAAQYGVSRTACFLKLDYYSLKQRLEGASIPAAASAFVELPPVPPLIAGECLIELEDATGARLRVQLKGQNPPDLLALSRSFWNAD